jgi:hypothetical protein
MLAGVLDAAGSVALLVLAALTLRELTRRLSRSADARARRSALAAVRRRLAESEAEAARWRAAVVQEADRKDVQMGRLESAAIRALDSAFISWQQRVEVLEEELRNALLQARDGEQQLDVERLRSDRLQSASAQRDEQLAALRTELAERDRRLELLGGIVPVPDRGTA